MLTPTLRIRSSLTVPADALTVAEVTDRFERAIISFGGVVDRTGPGELEFDVGTAESAARANLDADLGMVTSGRLTVVPIATGFRVTARVQPRVWLAVFSIAVWIGLLALIGLSGAVWRWLIAIGGIPMLIAAWGLIWISTHGFLEKTGQDIARELRKTG